MSLLTNRLSIFFVIVTTLTLLIGCNKDTEQTGVKDLLVKAQELQQAEKYEDAIRIYRKIARDYADTRQGANSQFMIGYIYANHLKDTEQAKIEINRFLDDYSATADSGLIVGAKFELKYMGLDVEEIPVLSDIGTMDTTVAVDEKSAGE